MSLSDRVQSGTYTQPDDDNGYITDCKGIADCIATLEQELAEAKSKVSFMDQAIVNHLMFEATLKAENEKLLDALIGLNAASGQISTGGIRMNELRELLDALEELEQGNAWWYSSKERDSTIRKYRAYKAAPKPLVLEPVDSPPPDYAANVDHADYIYFEGQCYRLPEESDE